METGLYLNQSSSHLWSIKKEMLTLHKISWQCTKIKEFNKVWGGKYSTKEKSCMGESSRPARLEDQLTKQKAQ